MPRRMKIGTTVQITSIRVLWLVFDGTGFERALKRTMMMTRRTSTKTTISPMTISRPLLKRWIISMIGDAAGWR